MSISTVSPLGNASYYPPASAEKAPADRSALEQGTPPQEDRFQKQPEARPGDDQVQTYGYTPPRPDAEAASTGEEQETGPEEQGRADETDGTQKTSGSDESGYTQEEQKQITELKARDTEVKAHEQAHIAAGGQYVQGGAHFEYQTGPDGEKYAVGGEVSIDVSKESGDPRATIAKMQTVIRAALAPASPSGQDRAVAAKATRMEMEARSEAMAETRTEPTDGAKTEPKGDKATDDTEAKPARQGTKAYTASMDTPTARPSINLYT